MRKRKQIWVESFKIKIFFNTIINNFLVTGNKYTLTVKLSM